LWPPPSIYFRIVNRATTGIFSTVIRKIDNGPGLAVRDGKVNFRLAECGVQVAGNDDLHSLLTLVSSGSSVYNCIKYSGGDELFYPITTCLDSSESNMLLMIRSAKLCILLAPAVV
jgi:hypothetical protein